MFFRGFFIRCQEIITNLRRLERVFTSRGDWFRVNAIPIRIGTLSNHDEFVDDDESIRTGSGSRTSSTAGKTNI